MENYENNLENYEKIYEKNIKNDEKFF